MREIVIDRLELRRCCDVPEKVFPQRNQHSCAVGSHVDAAEQFLPWRLHRRMQPGQALVVSQLPILTRAHRDVVTADMETRTQLSEEGTLLDFVERRIRVDDLTRQGHGRCVAGATRNARLRRDAGRDPGEKCGLAHLTRRQAAWRTTLERALPSIRGASPGPAKSTALSPGASRADDRAGRHFAVSTSW